MPALGEFPQSFLLVFGVALGLLFGSFLNVVIHRLPRDESVVHPGSRCPGCGKPIAAYDNIPVLSFLILRGKARCCGAPIAFRYPLVEALGGLYAAAVLELLVFDLPLDTPIWHAVVLFFAYLWLGLSLLAAAVIDLEYVYIPGALTTSSTVLAFATLPLREQVTPTEAVVGAVFGFLLVFLPFELGYKALRGRTGMARGDAMLVMLSGAWFGWFGAAFALGAAAIQGTLFLIVTLIVKGKVEETEAVDAELQAMREAVAQAEGEERAELERELAEDPLAEERLSGVGGMRLVFGPFIALAIVEYLLFGEFVRAALFGELS